MVGDDRGLQFSVIGSDCSMIFAEPLLALVRSNGGNGGGGAGLTGIIRLIIIGGNDDDDDVPGDVNNCDEKIFIGPDNPILLFLLPPIVVVEVDRMCINHTCVKY
ncbi:hypothetical protein DERP_003367 [Dermatophagoides pteronyssinus]|uniref:Uncharacterized protein n=1 Tax=Dermatophagoides pteronyssinus TaxID=6956 RepID=A0ABQ8JJB0_DERPT|nr:hypothetical protein DERP_003367 [Dermatophagoides pteronyssinus]